MPAISLCKWPEQMGSEENRREDRPQQSPRKRDQSPCKRDPQRTKHPRSSQVGLGRPYDLQAAEDKRTRERRREEKSCAEQSRAKERREDSGIGEIALVLFPLFLIFLLHIFDTSPQQVFFKGVSMFHKFPFHMFLFMYSLWVWGWACGQAIPKIQRLHWYALATI